MARIRTIKPEFWGDEKLAPLEPIDRLVFLGLISQADDAGRLVDAVRTLDGLLFPETDHSSRDSIETLVRLKRVRRYRSASGQKLLQIVKWDEHQKVANPSKHVLPPPPPEDVESQEVTEPSLDPHEGLVRSSVSDHGSRTMDHGSRILEVGASAHAKAGFTELTIEGVHIGRLLPAEKAYYRAADQTDPEIINRRWRTYLTRFDDGGVNLPGLAKWLDEGGHLDASLDPPEEKQVKFRGASRFVS